MKRLNKRIISLLLALALLIGGLFPVLSVHAVGSTANEVAPLAEGSSKQTQATIEKQIRAFADSIDKKNADDTAALALAKHGLTDGGKKLSVGKSHALTATLWNSELLQVALIETCAPIIETMQNLKLKEMNYVHGSVTWGLWEGSWGKTNYELRKYYSNQYTMPNIEYEIASGLMHSSKANAYDKSLEWMVSHAFITLTFRLVQVTDNEMTYQVTCEVDDRFDFDTSQGSGFNKLISDLAALLFKEFDWVSKVDFQLKVPNTCPHSGDFTSKVTKPTCAAEGYTTHTCSLCGYSYKDTYTAKTDHKFGSWKKIADPTCEGEGTETRTCSGCGTTETRSIAALGHSYTSAVIAPTCTAQGFTTYTCHCGNSYTDSYVNKLRHTMGEWIVDKAPTCTTEGSKIRKCSDCDYFETDAVEALGHSYEPVVTAPTCTKRGFTTYTCHCSDSYVEDYVDATGHTEIIDAAVDATCTTTGLTEGKHCSVCNETLTAQQTTDALGHDFSPEWTIDVEPTTTTLGQKSRHCSRCDEVTDIIEIAKLVEIIDTSKKFNDVTTSSWAKEGIDYVVSYGYMNGTGNGTTFSPSGTMSRSMIVTVLYRIAGQPSHSGYDPFTDITTGWYYDAVLWAYENGIVTGTSKTTFAPDGAVTREQMATFLYRFAKCMDYDISKTNDISTFPDASKVGSWAYDALAWANAEGLITGAKGSDGVTRLDPQDNATREQVATILMRFCKAFAK